jgi:hypothetical protein
MVVGGTVVTVGLVGMGTVVAMVALGPRSLLQGVQRRLVYRGQLPGPSLSRKQNLRKASHHLGLQCLDAIYSVNR